VALSTVIDQLIVRLALDVSQFRRGQQQVQAGVRGLQQQTQQANQQMGQSLGALATRWLGVAAAVMAVKKAVSIIDDTATRTRQLGQDAKNLGQAANEMRNFENAVVMMGGSAEAARKTIGRMQKAIFDLAYNGQMSDALVMLARLGVQFQDQTGHAKDFQTVVLETADAIGKAQANGMKREEAFQYLQASGFDEGTSNLILSGRANAEKELAAQRARRQVSAQDIQNATDINRAKIGKEQALTTVEERGMSFAGGIQKNVNEFMEHLASGEPGKAMDQLTDGAKHAAGWLEDLALKSGGLTRGIRNNNPGNLRAVGNQRRDIEGFRVFSSMEEGVKANAEQVKRYLGRGVNTMDSIVKTWAPAKAGNDVEAYLKDLEKDTGMKRTDIVQESDLATLLGAMFKHESGKGAPTAQDVADILTFQGDGPLGAASGAVPTPNAQGTTYAKTDVQIDSITVNTQAKDAEGVAAGLDGAVSRKLLASHAEGGMN